MKIVSANVEMKRRFETASEDSAKKWGCTPDTSGEHLNGIQVYNGRPRLLLYYRILTAKILVAELISIFKYTSTSLGE